LIDDEPVAAFLALSVDASGYPPDGRMVKENGYNHMLGEVNPQVVSANVAQLVRDNRFHLVDRRPC
jgi:hypothetical protein